MFSSNRVGPTGWIATIVLLGSLTSPAAAQPPASEPASPQLPAEVTADGEQALEESLPAAAALPRAESVRVVMRAIEREAELLRGVPSDQMTERYVQAAARTAASRLPAHEAPAACLLGLAIAMDSQGALARMPNLRPLCEAVETPIERQRRIQAIGSPTIFSRRDLCLHYFVSCGLAVGYGPRQAEMVGLLKELQDAMGGTGFSFVDYQANLCGIATAEWVLGSDRPVSQVLGNFQVNNFYPNPQGLPEGLPLRDFSTRYGSIRDPRFLTQRAQMLGRIAALPGFPAWAVQLLESPARE